MIDRNPARGLRIAETMAARDKRKPFTVKQLRLIFDAPIYRGCRDDGPGFAIPGQARPRRGRFWIPLIALFSGMRQNEICQMDVADVRTIESVLCFVVSAGSSPDKSLKTDVSDRLVPADPTLIEMGFGDIVAERLSRPAQERGKVVPIH